MRDSGQDEDDPVDNDSGNGRFAYRIGSFGQEDSWSRAVIESSSEIIKVVDPDGTLLYANPAFGRLLGYDLGEVVGNNVLDYVHPEDLPHVKEKTGRALAESGVARNILEYRFRHKDGSWVWVESVGTYLLDDPTIDGVVVNSRDITLRKENESKLREAEESLRSAFEDAAIGMALVSLPSPSPELDRRYLRVNRALCEMLGYTEQQLLSVTSTEVTYPADLDYSRARMEQMLCGEESKYTVQKRYVRSDGNLVCALLNVSLIRNVEGNPSHFVSQFQDITKRKKAEEELKESERRYATLISNAHAYVYRHRTGPGWPMEFVSEYARKLTGYDPEDLLSGKVSYEDLIPEQERQVVREEVQDALAGHRGFELHYTILRKDGETRRVKEHGQGVYGQDGGAEAVEGLVYDVTEEAMVQERLQEAEERYRTLVESIPAITYIREPSGEPGPNRTIYLSPQHEFIAGYALEESLEPGHRIEVIHPHDRERVLAEDRRVNETGEPFSMEYRQFTKDGRILWLRDDSTLVRDEQDNPKYWLGVQYDVTSRKTLESQLEHQAMHDNLTDLPNRQLFVDRLGHALERTRRHQSKVAVLFMDLDGFKVVNDSLGHKTGDRLLVDVSERLQRVLRPEDTLARFGGDEFVVLVEDIDGANGAVRVAERLTEVLRERFVREGRELFVSASIGIALGNAPIKTSEDLLRDSDTAMYKAKSDSSDYQLYDPGMHERVVNRLELENDLRRAIEAEEFVIHYQPIVRARTREIWGVEALVRWSHPEKGLLNPSEFVPVAEESGLIIPIGEQVLEEACRLARVLQEQHTRFPPLVMCVNLSARQLRRPDLANTIERTIGQTGIEPRSLSLDVTETSYIQVMEGNTAALDRLKKLGVRISIDDFGVGYSSLSYLKRLPADTLKIDKSFVAGLGANVEDTALVGMVVDLAHTLGMEVVAEGVEDEDQLALISEMDCDFAQGFYFSKPLPYEDLLKLVEEQ